MTVSTIITQQQQTETEAVDRGVERFKARLLQKTARQGFDKLDHVQKLIKGMIPILAEGVDEWIAQASQAKGRKPTALAAFKEIDSDTIAGIGTTAIMAELGKGGRVADIAAQIGRRLEIELEAKALEAEDPQETKRLIKLGEGDLSPRALEARFKTLIEKHGAALDWTINTKVLVGQVVINVALVKLAAIFVSRTVRLKIGQSHSVISLTDEGTEALAQMADAASLQHLPFRPMVAPPRKWEGLSSGAYYDYRLSRLVPLVRSRTREQRKALKDAMSAGTMNEVLDALNAIQDTRWAIDEDVLLWVKWARDHGVRPSASYPTRVTPVTPPRIEPEVWATFTPEVRQALSRERRTIRKLGAAIACDNHSFDNDTAEAEHLAGFAEFYLPHSLDFRGRTYAVPYFNHQRSDHLKALFRFADGVPLGPDGGKWLMIHLANCGDYDKVSKEPFEARIAWVEANAAKIIATAADPEVFLEFWTEADSPFCFLQACFEYARWMYSGYSQDFLSTIAGAADGSCSGLQHYSCITRSAEEAYHVNLLPRPDVGDIYKVTAVTAIPTLQALAARVSDDEKEALEIKAASIILSNGFGRSEVKRNVMTYFYGSARFGMRDQHMEDTMRPLGDQVAMGKIDKHPYDMLTSRTDKVTKETTMKWDGGYSCASVMAAHVYHAVTTVAAKADEASSWIRTVAGILAHEGQSMCWTAPTGFPVVQRYAEYTSKIVNLWLYNHKITVPTSSDKTDQEGNVLARVQLLLRQAPTSRIDKNAMRNASSPNVIHSMDAAHLHRSVAMAKAAGIDSFSMIHDSFGTHLGNMEKFSGIIREALVSCYEDYCPLKEIDQQARKVLSDEGQDKLPPLPERGNLDLGEIRKAVFAFA